MDFRNYFDVLGVQKDAGFEEIKLAYRKLSKKFHPDLNEGNDYAKEKFFEVQEAYRNLSFRNNRNNTLIVQQQNRFYPGVYENGIDEPFFKRLDNGSDKEFIPKSSKIFSTTVWFLVAVAAVLVILYFTSAFDSRNGYVSGIITGFNLSPFSEKTMSEIAIKPGNPRPSKESQQKLAVIEREKANETRLNDTTASKKEDAGRNTDRKKFVYLEDYLTIKSHKELASFFGAGAVRKSTQTSLNREVNICSELKLKNGHTLFFVWEDENKYQKLRYLKAQISNNTETIKERGSRIYSKQGIYLGMPVIKLQELNASPVYFYGWGTGNSGVLAANKKGLVDFSNLNIKLACQDCSRKYLSSAKFSSADAVADNQDIYVRSITVAD